MDEDRDQGSIDIGDGEDDDEDDGEDGMAEGDMEDSFGGDMENFNDVGGVDDEDFGNTTPDIRMGQGSRDMGDEWAQVIHQARRDAMDHRMLSNLSGYDGRREEGGFSSSNRRQRHSVVPSLRAMDEASNAAARVFLNADGGMRIRLGNSAPGGLMELLENLPAALTMHGANASVSIVDGAGVMYSSNGATGDRGGDVRARMRSLMSGMMPPRQGRPEDQPHVHPLLNVGEPMVSRRGVGGTGLGRYTVRRPGIQLAEGYDNSFVANHAPNQRRNTLGPLLSDRRWGTDLGVDACFSDSRLPVLTSAVEEVLNDVIQVTTDVSISSSRRASRDRQLSNLGFNQLDEAGIMDVSESKEEGELQEHKEGDEESAFDLDAPDYLQEEEDDQESEEDMASGEIISAEVATTSHENSVEGVAPMVEGLLGSSLSRVDEDDVAQNSHHSLDDISHAQGSLDDISHAQGSLDDISHAQGSVDDISQARGSIVTERAVAFSDDEIFDEENNAMSIEGDIDESQAANLATRVCPSEYDPEVWASLPPDLQEEILGIANAEGTNQITQENDVVAVPPQEMQIATSAVDNVANENLAFVSSLSADLRRDVFLSADAAFISSLPDNFQAEARRIRRAMGFDHPAVREAAVRSNDIAAIGNHEGDLWNPVQAAARDALMNVSRRVRGTAAVADSVEVPRVSTHMSTADDRLDAVLPFESSLAWRLLRYLMVGPKARAPRPLLRLLSGLCRYKQARRPLLAAVASLLLNDASQVSHAMARLSGNSASVSDLGDEQVVLSLVSVGVELDAVLLRRILSGLSYLNRKVPRLVWLDLMRRNDGDIWIFGSLVDLMGRQAITCGFESGVDVLLHLVDEMCEPMSKLTPAQAQQLCGSSSTDPSTDNEESKSSEDVVQMEITPVVITEDPEGLLSLRETLPYPILTIDQCVSLARVARAGASRASSNKMIMRILKALALYGPNWKGLLDELTEVARSLSGEVSQEIGRVCLQLQEVVHLDGDASTAIATPTFSTPSVNVDSTLFQVLTYIKTMRVELDTSESEVLVAHIKSIQFGNIWTLLSESLELVRRIEGLTETLVEERGTASGATPSRSSPPSLSSSTSTLIMRFLPLIQTFLTVCDSTILTKPTAGAEGVESVVPNTVLKKRLRNEDAEVTAVLLKAIDRLVRPGERFRRHPDYFKMQMELVESPLTEQLVVFIEKNSVLVNMLLNHNIALLDGSFRPLISVPRLRQKLHFDLKREYFRVKMKKLRHSARAHGPLRLNVRRDHVFEDSLNFFERLRTGEEVRRKLSINFDGEDGMDAGGLTREWYTVLAREMFNPNYALFTATGDGVTFQPNANSHYHTHHLIYFKFVGRVIGKAICDGQLLDAHFTRSFYKHMLGLSVNYHDLEAIEPDYFKSLKQLLEIPLEALGLDLTFSIEVDEFGHTSTKPLVDGGQDLPVTDDNKAVYVQLVAHSRMTTTIQRQV
jgi:hypothetical protein